MKFDDLFNKVFVAERKNEATEVANPEDFNDVEPLPLPETPEIPLETDTNAPEAQPQTVAPSTAGNIGDYINELEDFANKLNGTEASSLQSLVSQLDRPGTPFDGISARTRGEIVRVAETLRSISENLKSFIINAAKK
jgi:hypothetical protein